MIEHPGTASGEAVGERDIAAARAYPTQRDAAEMLDIAESTLSRSDAEAITAGERGRRYRPSVVLEQAAKYRKRPVNEVALALLSYARERSPEDADHVEAEIEEFFATRVRPQINRQSFLEQARRTLPRRLYEQVKRAYDYGLEENGSPTPVEQVVAREG